MFTFIKIAYHGAIHGRNVERLGHKPHPRTQQPEHDGRLQTNPWERELKRLTEHPPGDRRQYFRSQLPKPGQGSKPARKQATQQDLKSWWGQSCAPNKSGQQLDLSYFAPPPSQGRNHWFKWPLDTVTAPRPTPCSKEQGSSWRLILLPGG